MNGVFAKRLTEKRIEKNFTQESFAKLVGFSRARYANYEQGRREPDFETVKLFSNKLGVSTDYLLGSVDNQNIKENPIQKVIDHAETMNLAPEEREAIEEYKKMLPSEQQKELLDAIETIKNLPEANREVLLKFIKVFSSSCQ